MSRRAHRHSSTDGKCAVSEMHAKGRPFWHNLWPWWLFHQPRQSSRSAIPTRALPRELLWLLDAPLFIDAAQVDAFFDAILRPEREQVSESMSRSLASTSELTAGLTAGDLIPGLSAELAASRSETTEEAMAREYRIVSNPFRHLLLLAIHYSTALPRRLRFFSWDAAGCGCSKDWSDPAFITGLPRALAFIDFPPGSKFIPTAMETEDGVTLLFSALADKFTKRRKDHPSYPGSKSSRQERAAYWDWFAERFDARKAMLVIEEGAPRAKIRWIDFRVPPLDPACPPLHLHVATRGSYDKGVLAYNFVNRGFRHGMRIVGTLKSEPDLNVLAIFER